VSTVAAVAAFAGIVVAVLVLVVGPLWLLRRRAELRRAAALAPVYERLGLRHERLDPHRTKDLDWELPPASGQTRRVTNVGWGTVDGTPVRVFDCLSQANSSTGPVRTSRWTVALAPSPFTPPVPLLLLRPDVARLYESLSHVDVGGASPRLRWLVYARGLRRGTREASAEEAAAFVAAHLDVAAVEAAIDATGDRVDGISSIRGRCVVVVATQQPPDAVPALVRHVVALARALPAVPGHEVAEPAPIAPA
jgi:hypothetical protein